MIDEKTELLVEKALWLANWAQPDQLFQVVEFLTGMAEVNAAREAGIRQVENEYPDWGDEGGTWENATPEMHRKVKLYVTEIYREKFGEDIEKADRRIEGTFIKRFIPRERLEAWEETRQLPCKVLPAWHGILGLVRNE